MTFLVIKVWLALLHYEVVAKLYGYQAVLKTARNDVRATAKLGRRVPLETIRDAVEIGAALYFKQVHCLQRSCVGTHLLREAGWDAHLTIGVQIVPFSSHAWIELDGAVVNDRPYVREKYRVLEQAGGTFR